MEKTKTPVIKDEYKICITGGSGFIGSNLIRVIKSISNKASILNLDLVKPADESQVQFWKSCDVNIKDEISSLIEDFKPNYIIHLAADATMFGKSLDDYKTNILGIKNLINAVKSLPSESSLIVTSSQHVKKPGTFIYRNIDEYCPLGLYGKSKVITEELIKKSNLKINWFIVRPTLVWGPGNKVMAESIFKYISKNIYYHPSQDNTVRSYGYVDNVCYQILKLCELDASKIDNRIFYVADNNLLQIEWIELAHLCLINKNTKMISKGVLKNGSYFGDVIKKFYPKFPLYTERYLNLTTSNPVPLDRTFSYLGSPLISLDEGMLRTKKWLEFYYSNNL